MAQGILDFDAPAQRHSATSVAAAASLTEQLPRLRRVVLASLSGVYVAMVAWQWYYVVRKPAVEG